MDTQLTFHGLSKIRDNSKVLGNCFQFTAKKGDEELIRFLMDRHLFVDDRTFTMADGPCDTLTYNSGAPEKLSADSFGGDLQHWVHKSDQYKLPLDLKAYFTDKPDILQWHIPGAVLLI